MRLGVSEKLLSEAHLKWCEIGSEGRSLSFGSVALPRLEVWVENSMYDSLNHNI